MEFTYDDAKKLCALLTRQEVLVDKKRRWLASMIHKPEGLRKKVKRPKFLSEAYLPESYIRSEENDTLNAIWYVQRLKHEKLKMLVYLMRPFEP
ncbi:hypothetical protein PR202_gb09019 [Eleusine coracana subsp. coracana]|uniref:Uncharacterized protein n=1 Tax=Eleusine coracana subsp. coracana TaxID=191504 RepID=A0AAV5EGY8_ELECO|nr:hypothetical protein PR202_gb09019 [Eleusine coracana subsp. coracana]